MKTVLVTGPTGCVGSNLVPRLLSAGSAVRVYARPSWRGREAEFAGAEPFYGDIRDRESLARAVSGCDVVYHTAALVSFRREDRSELLSVNRGGTEAVVEAALSSGVRRLVHVSSVAAVGRRADGDLADESTPFNWPERLSYRYSKHLAEAAVRSGVRRGLDAVIVNPSVIVGPGDRYLHGGQLVRDAVRRRLLLYPGGGMNLVGVHDVVEGLLLAAERGRTGERYILGGTNLTHREAFHMAALLLDAPPPRVRIPRTAVLALAAAVELGARVLRVRPLLTRDLVAGVGRHQWFSIRKARTELGYNPVSLERSILEARRWYAERGIV